MEVVIPFPKGQQCCNEMIPGRVLVIVRPLAQVVCDRVDAKYGLHRFVVRGDRAEVKDRRADYG